MNSLVAGIRGHPNSGGMFRVVGGLFTEPDPRARRRTTIPGITNFIYALRNHSDPAFPPMFNKPLVLRRRRRTRPTCRKDHRINGIRCSRDERSSATSHQGLRRIALSANDRQYHIGRGGLTAGPRRITRGP